MRPRATEKIFILGICLDQSFIQRTRLIFGMVVMADKMTKTTYVGPSTSGEGFSAQILKLARTGLDTPVLRCKSQSNYTASAEQMSNQEDASGPEALLT